MPRDLVNITAPILDAFQQSYDRARLYKQAQFDNELKQRRQQEIEAAQKEQMRQFDETLKQRKQEHELALKTAQAQEEYKKFLMESAVRQGIKEGTFKPQQQPGVFENLNQLAASNPSVPSTSIRPTVTVMGHEIPTGELPEETTEQYRERLAQEKYASDLEQATLAADARMQIARDNRAATEARDINRFRNAKELEGIKQKNRITLKSIPSPNSGLPGAESSIEDMLAPFVVGSDDMPATMQGKYANNLSTFPWYGQDPKDPTKRIIRGRGASPVSTVIGKDLEKLRGVLPLIEVLHGFKKSVDAGDLVQAQYFLNQADARTASLREALGAQAFGVLNIPEVARLRKAVPGWSTTAVDKILSKNLVQQSIDDLVSNYMQQVETKLNTATKYPLQREYLMKEYGLWIPPEMRPTTRGRGKK